MAGRSRGRTTPPLIHDRLAAIQRRSATTGARDGTIDPGRAHTARSSLNHPPKSCIQHDNHRFIPATTPDRTINSQPNERAHEDSTASQWKTLVSRTAQTGIEAGCPYQLLVIDRSQLHWQTLQRTDADRVLSHRTLSVIFSFSALCLLIIDIAPTLSPTRVQLLLVGVLLMLSAFLAHLTY